LVSTKTTLVPVSKRSPCGTSATDSFGSPARPRPSFPDSCMAAPLSVAGEWVQPLPTALDDYCTTSHRHSAIGQLELSRSSSRPLAPSLARRSLWAPRLWLAHRSPRVGVRFVHHQGQTRVRPSQMPAQVAEGAPHPASRAGSDAVCSTANRSLYESFRAHRSRSALLECHSPCPGLPLPLGLAHWRTGRHRTAVSHGNLGRRDSHPLTASTRAFALTSAAGVESPLPRGASSRHRRKPLQQPQRLSLCLGRF